MLSASFNSLQFRRPSTTARHAARSRRPLLESMEARCLLTSYMAIDTPDVIEGAGGTTPMAFTVKLFRPATSQVTVDYKTTDNSAKAGSDYIATSGRLTFAPGESTKTITVQVIGDSEVELTETFYVDLSKPTNAVILKSRGVGTIMDDDTAAEPGLSRLSIDGVSMTRGLDDYKLMIFTVSLSTESDSQITVTASTRNVTAVAGVDYEATRETLVFAPGETTKQFTVKIYGTSEPTPDKVFHVDLTDASFIAPKVKTGAGVLEYGA